MKKPILLLTMLLALLLPFSAAAEDTTASVTEKNPSLTAISFKNATIDGEFSSQKNQYTLILDNQAITPTLEQYTVDGEAELFVTYTFDDAKHQTGILVTLEYPSGASKYQFDYQNAKTYEKSSNNLLQSVSCRLGAVYPDINDKDTEYKLYIPSDMTVLRLSAVTQEVGAYCDLPKEIELGANQEPTISLTVTASDGTIRAYTLKIKRLNKTAEEVQQAMKQGDIKDLIQGEMFYQKPSFYITVLAALCGIALVIVLVNVMKRVTVKAEDAEEEEFFAAE